MRDRVAESLSPMRCHWAKDWNPSDHYGDQGRIVIFRSSPYSHEDSLELMHSPCDLIARKLYVLPYHAVPVPPSRRWEITCLIEPTSSSSRMAIALPEDAA